MAIGWMYPRYIKRSNGGNVVRTVAYNTRSQMFDQRLGIMWSGIHKLATLIGIEVILPIGGHEKFRDAEILVNAQDASEKRRDSVLGRDFIVPLPNGEPVERQWELARGFFKAYFVDHGVPVILALHRAHGGHDGQKENDHAHAWVGERRLEGERLSAQKARLHEPEVRTNGRRYIANPINWSQAWREYQESHGIQVDPPRAIPGKHLGAGHARNPTSAAFKRQALLNRLNAQLKYMEQDMGVDYQTLRDEHDLDLKSPQRFPLTGDGLVTHRIIADGPFNGPDIGEELALARYRDYQQEQHVAQHREQVAPLKEPTLYDRYQAERTQALSDRKAAEQEIYQQFSGYNSQLRSFYTVQHQQQKLEVLRGTERRKEHEVLKAEQGRDRIEAHQLRAQQLAAARSAHPVPTWDAFLTRESGRGDPEAERLLKQRQQREAQQGHER